MSSRLAAILALFVASPAFGQMGHQWRSSRAAGVSGGPVSRPQQPDWSYSASKTDPTVPVPTFRPNGRELAQKWGLEPTRTPPPRARSIETAQWQDDFDPPPVPSLDPTPGGQRPIEPDDPFGAPVYPRQPYVPYWNEILAGPVVDFPEVYLFGLVEGFEISGAKSRLAGRFGGNVGLPIMGEFSRLGIQLGGSASVAEGGGQFIFSGGAFYRADPRLGQSWNFGAVVDVFSDDFLGGDVIQIRARASVLVTAQSEFGAWGAVSVSDDDLGPRGVIDSVDQANLFYRWLWPNGKDTTIWAGWRSDPDSFALGGDMTMPLSGAWAMTLGGFYGAEDDTWNAYTGLILYFGGHARLQAVGEFPNRPYLPVADNTRMSLFRQ